MLDYQSLKSEQHRYLSPNDDNAMAFGFDETRDNARDAMLVI